MTLNIKTLGAMAKLRHIEKLLCSTLYHFFTANVSVVTLNVVALNVIMRGVVTMSVAAQTIFSVFV
jgi:hypothetical protein